MSRHRPESQNMKIIKTKHIPKHREDPANGRPAKFDKHGQYIRDKKQL